MNDLKDLVSVAKINELLHKKEEEDKKKNQEKISISKFLVKPTKMVAI